MLRHIRHRHHLGVAAISHIASGCFLEEYSLVGRTRLLRIFITHHTHLQNATCNTCCKLQLRSAAAAVGSRNRNCSRNLPTVYHSHLQHDLQHVVCASHAAARGRTALYACALCAATARSGVCLITRPPGDATAWTAAAWRGIRKSRSCEPCCLPPS